MEQLSNINTIKGILARHGFTFSKSLGQNFLINPSVCPRMADECGVTKESGVIEVGPGIGVLTYELAKNSKKVVAVELDRRLLPVLNETLQDFDNVKIINDDVLKVDMHKLIKEEFSDMDVVVCANLPYYITSPVIMKLLEDKIPIKALTVMVQKEAAERICAPVGSRESGAVTVSINYYAQPELLFHVKAGSFMPAPKVDSSVIRLNIRKSPPIVIGDEALFFKVIKAAFAQRRKTLSNSLSAGLNISKEKINNMISCLAMKPTVRAEELSMGQFGQIVSFLENE
ncbi:MAG: 16S rRNA (adenine(1518)-N(6)/adenine(1519)-N(6))-dimethyltransferase RsmA [Bacillota bacterium]|nr:16S rRNA (adenine(1518)-N(6)/adenine(1519)-N(6))-dimethyltransferase RsmA [Bacillota bacterium]